ncbi:pyrroline-5-carboxylate reductase [uncultured Jannaschia sp.]|uniref:pyrroline-5-carboxylate reductase n=1 Tax=uncultured Jannaschia sp. TaxID=293347 RepID=UPI0026288913|nr:pyrroline-5-carboxylate reductase [uncultured Jannaschia sp.]
MDLLELNDRGVLLLGCGKMGGALLAGWLEKGLPPASVAVLDPKPSDWLSDTGVRLNAELPARPAITLIAVKPQMMGDALPVLRGLADTLYVSIAAGTPIAAFEEAFGPEARIVRAMPNTPAAIGRGITAIIGNAQADDADLDMAETLLDAVGEVVRLDDEAQMDAVTGLSGSGPAYVFHMIETMAEAGIAQGLDRELALRLARATVAGAGALAMTGEDPGQLRRDVTSPNGTTQAGLEVLMAELPDLMARTVAAAADRSRELRA